MSIEKQLKEAMIAMHTTQGGQSDVKLADKLQGKAFERNVYKTMLSELKPEVTFEERWALLQEERADTVNFWKALEAQRAISKRKRVTLDPMLGGCPGYNPLDRQARHEHRKDMVEGSNDTQPMKEAYKTMIAKKLMDENPLTIVPCDEFTGDALSYGTKQFQDGYVIAPLTTSQTEEVTKQYLDKVCNDFQERFKGFLDGSEYKLSDDTNLLTSNPWMTNDTNLYMESLRKLTLDKIVNGAVPQRDKLMVTSTPNTNDGNFFTQLNAVQDLESERLPFSAKDFLEKWASLTNVQEVVDTTEALSNKFMNYFDISEWPVSKDFENVRSAADNFDNEWLVNNAHEWEDNCPGSTLTFEKPKWRMYPSRINDTCVTDQEVKIDFTGYKEATFKPGSRTMFMQSYPSVSTYEDLKEWTTEGPVHVEDATADGVEKGVAAIYTWITPEGELLKNGSWVRICCIVGPAQTMMPANYRSKPADPFKVKLFIDTYTG